MPKTIGAALVAALAMAGAATAAMHPQLGARLAGMGRHGVANLQLKQTAHEICWTFDIPTQGATAASIRDAHGMRVAALGARYKAKGCSMVPANAIGLIEARPSSYWVWVDTKGHPGELRGKLFAGMAHR
jgi:hypothetical protein